MAQRPAEIKERVGVAAAQGSPGWLPAVATGG